MAINWALENALRAEVGLPQVSPEPEAAQATPGASATSPIKIDGAGNKTITPLRVADTTSQTQSTYWRDKLLLEAQQAYTNNFRNTLSHKWADHYHGQAVEQEKKRENGLNAGINAVNSAVDEYNAAYHAYSNLENANKKILAEEPGVAALLGGRSEKALSEAQKALDDAKKKLDEYGITVNNGVADLSWYNDAFYNNLKGYAKQREATSKYIPQNGLFSHSTSFDIAEDLSLISDDEMQLYNYLVERDSQYTQGYKQYLLNLVEQRKGQARAEEIQGMYNGPEKAVVRGVEALKSGLAGTYNAAMATATGRDMNTSASQYAADILRTDLQNQGKTTLGFDAMQSIGGMIPGVVAGLANPIAGAAVFGATSGASGYQQKLAEGWSKQDAAAYGVLTGASEALLGKFLGGIPSLGGKIGGVMSKALPKIDNAIGRVVARVGGEAFSEAREEVIQAILEPAIATIVGNVDFDAPNAEELIYTALIGAVTSVGLGAPGAISEISRPITSGLNDNSAATASNPILDAKSLDEVVSATQTRDDMDVASAKVRSDEAMMGELQNTVGRQLNNSNDVKLAIAELQLKAAVEQKLSAAVAEGTPQAIEKALMEIANNPRELNVLNKYYGNLPGTVEGNIEFAKKVANGQAVDKPTETTTPEKVDEGQEVRNIIDQMAGIAPIEEEAIQSPVEAQEDAGVQVTPDATQEAEQTASERLNHQLSDENLSLDTLAMLYPELVSKKESKTAIDVFVDDAHANSDAVELSADDMNEYAVAKRQAEKDYGAMMEKWYAQHPEQTLPPIGHYLADKTKWVKDRAEVILKKLDGDKYTDEYFDRLDSFEQKNSILGNINMSPEEKVAALKDAGIPGEWVVDNGVVVNAETQGKKIKTRDEIIEDIINDVVPDENPHNPKQRPLKLSMREEPSAGVGVTKTFEHDSADKELAARLDAERAEKDRYKIKPIKERHGKQEAIDVYPSLNEIESGAVEIDLEAERQWQIENAVKLAQQGVTPEQFKNATGFIKYANGNIVDPTTGAVVWSPNGRNAVDAKRNLPQDNGNRTEDQRISSGTVQKNAEFNRRAIDSDNKHPGNTGADGSVIELGSDDSTYLTPMLADERSGDSRNAVIQPPPSRSLSTDEAELNALDIEADRAKANEESQYQETRYADKHDIRSSGDYTQQQRDAEREAQRQREQDGLPKYDVDHEYGSDTVAKFSDFDSRIGNLIDEQRVFKDGKAEGTKVSESVSRLNNGKEILNMARDVMRGDLSIQDFANEYYAIENSASSYLYSKDIADALREAVLDVSPTRNTDYTQVTQGKKAKDITAAMQMLVHRAEKAAEYKIVSSNLSKQIRTSKNKASGIALMRYFNVQATPDTFFKALGGFNREGNSEAYALADEALENNATEKRERSAGYSFFTDVTKHKDFEAFAKNKLMSGYVVNSVELTAQEAVSLLHSLRSVREQTKNYSEGHPDSIAVVRDGKSVPIASISGRNDLRNLEEEIESHITGIAKEYSEALDKMFAHYSPKFLNAIKDSTGLDREASPEGKYFPLFYIDGGDGATFNIAEALQSRFEKLGFAKERTGPGSALQIFPAAQVADNYIAQVSHYIGWASFSNKLNMLNSNIDGTGSFLSTIADVYSPNAANLMADYIRDVGGYKTSDSDNWFNQLLGRFAGAVITGRPSTAFSQLSSVYAAGGIIKPEAIRQSGVIFPVKRKHVNLDDGLLADRARHGMNDSTISEITRNADSKIKNAIEKIPGGKKYLNLVGIADAYTTKQLYAACWCDVRMDYPDVQNSNPKLFDTLVEDKFTEAILFSQSDADRINNAALYRGDGAKGSIMRALSMFTGQPNKQLNMVMTALGEYNAAKGDAKKDAAKTLANTVRGQAGAAVSYAMLKTVASLVLHKWYDFKDDEDELDLNEIARSALSESISTFTGMLWFGETVSDKFMYAISDGKWGNNFDLQVNGVSQLFNLADSVTNALGIVNGDVPTAKEIKDLAINVANVTGAPIQGAYDFVNALALWGVDAYNGIVKGEKPKANYDIAKYIDKQTKAKKKAEAAAEKEVAKQEQDAIDMLINAGKEETQEVESVYGKTAAEIDAINKDIDAFKKDKDSEFDTDGDHAIAKIVLDSGLTEDGIDAMIVENTGKPYRETYDILRTLGLTPAKAAKTYADIDSDSNGSLKQAEMKAAYLEDEGIEYIIKAIWDSKGYKTDWDTYKAK